MINLIIKNILRTGWAAGKNNRDLVSLLLSRDSGDKFGTTPRTQVIISLLSHNTNTCISIL